jgi:hypothetical protein
MKDINMNTILETTNNAVTTNVLLKDSSDTTNVLFFGAKSLTDMEASRITWEQGAYRTSNQALYAVLAECLAFCGELPISEAKQRSSALAAFYKSRGYTYKQDLPLATRVVRAVFGVIDRRRISTYSLVLRQAQKENIAVSDLAAWIEERGGVQEISLGRSTTYISPKTKAEIAKNNLQGKSPIGFAKSELLSHLADANKLGDMCVLLAEQQADGSFGIYAVLRQDGLVKAAFTSMYSLGQEILAKAQAEVNAANDADGLVVKLA